MPSTALSVLLVEDDPVDIVSFERLARKHDLGLPIATARNGKEALEALARGESFIILTDLNMPGISGHELVEAIRHDAALKRSIVFIVTSSDLSSDKARAYDCNVAGYVVKDARSKQLAQLIEMLKLYATTVALPPDQSENPSSSVGCC